jgi:hypothetical protein
MVRPVMARLHLEYIAPGSYDTALLANSAVSADGDLSRKDDMIKAIERADFATVRGGFRPLPGPKLLSAGWG